MPDFEIECAADAYTFYVLILKIPESTFWAAPVWFLDSVAADYTAYDNWMAYEKNKALEGRRGRHGKR